MKLQIVMLFVIFTIIVVAMLWFISRNNSRAPTIDTIWVINLDKDKDRMNNIQQKTQSFSELVNRWQATYGKEQTVDTVLAEGVSRIMCTKRYEGKDTNEKPTHINRNEGAIGCWLSHTRLMKHLASMDLPSHWGHLIVEDDADFPPNFMEQWNERRLSIPPDWDIIFIGIHYPVGTQAGYKLLKGVSTNDTGNWGCHAYMVRHGALAGRILPRIKYMSHEIDTQLNHYFDDLNVYLMDPPIIHVNKALAANSSINVK